MSPAQQDEMVAGMKEVMESYEREMRAPVKNLVMGQLVRSLLIQVQRLKLDTEAGAWQFLHVLYSHNVRYFSTFRLPVHTVPSGGTRLHVLLTA